MEIYLLIDDDVEVRRFHMKFGAWVLFQFLVCFCSLGQNEFGELIQCRGGFNFETPIAREIVNPAGKVLFAQSSLFNPSGKKQGRPELLIEVCFWRDWSFSVLIQWQII